MMLNGTAFCQSYYRIEVGKLDTLFFYALKGKSCDSLKNSLQTALDAQEAQLQAQGKLIDLRGQQIENYALLDANWAARMQNANDLYQIDKHKIKTKLKKARKIAIGEGGIICLLLAVMLL